MAPSNPAYKHFLTNLQRVHKVSNSIIEFEAESIDICQVSKCFEYERVKEMVNLEPRGEYNYFNYYAGVVENQNTNVLDYFKVYYCMLLQY